MKVRHLIDLLLLQNPEADIIHFNEFSGEYSDLSKIQLIKPGDSLPNGCDVKPNIQTETIIIYGDAKY